MDKTTNLPIDSVYIEVTSAQKMLYTDSSGKFNVCNRMGGCMPCKDITLRFSKPDYKTVTLTNPGKDEIVWLER
jgi:hypothetical protein